MKTSLKGKVEILGHEGICLSPYLDSVGVWTIAGGATKSEIPNLNGNHPDITIKEALDLFSLSIRKYENAVNKALNVAVTQEQFDALVSICYNIGTGGLAGSTFIKRINAGASSELIAQAIKMWNKPKEIMGRRNKEARLFAYGAYSNNGKALLFPVNPVTHHPMYNKGKEIDVLALLEDKS